MHNYFSSLTSKIIITIFCLFILRLLLCFLIRAPYLYYDEQIYFWTAKHYSAWGSFHYGMDSFPAFRIIYQWLISPLCKLPFPVAYRLIQLTNCVLFVFTLMGLLSIFKLIVKNYILIFTLIIVGLSPTFFIAGQIMPENLMLALGTWSLFFFFLSLKSKQSLFTDRKNLLYLLFSLILFAFAVLSKPHIIMVAPILVITYIAKNNKIFWYLFLSTFILIVLFLLSTSYIFRNNQKLEFLLHLYNRA